LDAIHDCDVLVIPPSNPVVSVGTILGVPGVAEAVRNTSATVVGVSPIIDGAPVRGMAHQLLPAIGVDVAAGAVGMHYGSRSRGGLLDGWLVDVADEGALPSLEAAGIRARAIPLHMSDVERTTELARATLGLAADLKALECLERTAARRADGPASARGAVYALTVDRGSRLGPASGA
jgi:LPPG:FO 2-phospho-L-lactate transferase